MRIVWVCNTIIADIAEKYGLPLAKPESWISGLFLAFRELKDHEIIYCFPYQNSFDVEEGNFHFVSFQPNFKKVYPQKTRSFFKDIFVRFNPDVIHIFGTEFPHSLYALEACKTIGVLEKCVIHIQGLVSFISLHNGSCLPKSIVNGMTARDLIKRSSIRMQNASFRKKGKFEIKTIQLAKNVIGRTDWDRASTSLINPSVRYFSCDEVLRDSFYRSSWSLDKCERHSIFISQSNYPLKGFHVALEAIYNIKDRYPDLKIYTTGKDLLGKGWINKLKLSRYQKYILSLLKKYGLQERTFFLGYLSESEMCERIKKSHVSILSSFLENSPNSLCESMILGVPTISTYVGGVSSLFTDKVDGFCYPFDEPELLSHYLKRIFDDEELALRFSANSKKHALKTHDKEKILNTLLAIYSQISHKD